MTEKEDEFTEWVKSLGFNGKQLTEAATLVGISAPTAWRVNKGMRELTKTERLAMAAVRAGLNPWTPENDHELDDLRLMRKIIDNAVKYSASVPRTRSG